MLPLGDLERMLSCHDELLRDPERRRPWARALLREQFNIDAFLESLVAAPCASRTGGTG